MLKIENRSKDTIKSYSFKLEKDGKSITKTEKDFPISETIEIKIDSDEIKKSKLESANAKLIIVYSNGKKHIVESSNLNFATTDINVVTYGSAKKLNINTRNLLKDKRVDYTENQYFTIIQSLVDAYMEEHPVDVSKITESQIKSMIDDTVVTKEELEAVKNTIPTEAVTQSEVDSSVEKLADQVNNTISTLVTTLATKKELDSAKKTIPTLPQDMALKSDIDTAVAQSEAKSYKLKTNITSTIAIGNIAKGKSFAKGTTVEDVLKAILAPVLNPTLTAPKATLTATGSKLLEKGSTLKTTMTVTFDRGSISPAYGTDGYRAGEATGYKLNGGTAQNGNTFEVTVSEATPSYTATVTYAQGTQPKNSENGNYSSPLAAGSVTSNKIDYEFVDTLWSNVSNITSVAKMSLISKGTKTKTFVFPAQTISNPEIFDVPASWTVGSIEVLNDLSGKYEDCSKEFTKTTVTHNDASGKAVSYNRYTDNRGYAAGKRTIKITWQ